jgi:hypothetical protein
MDRTRTTTDISVKLQDEMPIINEINEDLSIIGGKLSDMITESEKNITEMEKNITNKIGSYGLNVHVPITFSEIIYYGLAIVIMIIILFTVICAIMGNHESIIKLIEYILGRVERLASGVSMKLITR